MKVKIIIAIAVIVGMAAFLMMQHQAQAKLRQQNESLQQQIDQLTKLQAANQRLSEQLAQASKSEEFAENQLNEFSRRKQTSVQPGVSNQWNLPSASSAPKTAGTELPKNSWINAGFDSPESTLKTRGWAVLNGDREQFAQSISLTDGARKMIEDQLVQMAAASKDPNTQRLLQQALAEKWGAEEAVLMPMMALNQNNTFTGYKILSQQSPSADEMILNVETEMASAPPTAEALDFQRFGDKWKIVINEDTVKKEMSQ